MIGDEHGSEVENDDNENEDDQWPRIAPPDYWDAELARQQGITIQFGMTPEETMPAGQVRMIYELHVSRMWVVSEPFSPRGASR